MKLIKIGGDILKTEEKDDSLKFKYIYVIKKFRRNNDILYRLLLSKVLYNIKYDKIIRPLILGDELGEFLSLDEARNFFKEIKSGERDAYGKYKEEHIEQMEIFKDD